jgi:hypothetical protein
MWYRAALQREGQVGAKRTRRGESSPSERALRFVAQQFGYGPATIKGLVKAAKAKAPPDVVRMFETDTHVLSEILTHLTL